MKPPKENMNIKKPCKFIYIPKKVTREKVDIIFPWLGKEWKVKEIPFTTK